MGVLTANSNVPIRGGEETSMKSAVVDIFYQGAVISHAVAGGVTPVPVASGVFAGICAEYKSAAIGDEICLYHGGTIGIPNTNFAAAHVSGLCFVDFSAGSDNPADLINTNASGPVGAGGD